MHADELEIEQPLVRQLLAERFPEWARLPLQPVPSAGTDNALFRLGEELLVRLPRRASAAEPIEKEHRWLPLLAPQLPLEVPVPVAKGRPGSGYPWDWSIYPWLEGEIETGDDIADRSAATDLGRFVAALQKLDPDCGPAPGAHNAWRGEPLSTRDAETREAIGAVGAAFDGGALTAAWEAALDVPAWDGPGVWLHGDLIATNLLVRDGLIAAVIDWGTLGVGDPACDAMAAWTLLAPGTREVFRARLEIDDPTWARGRGWALSWGLIAFPYYELTNPVLAGHARRAITEVLADPEVLTGS